MRLLKEKLAEATAVAEKEQSAAINLAKMAADDRTAVLEGIEDVKKQRTHVDAVALALSYETLNLKALEAALAVKEARFKDTVADNCKTWVDAGYGTADAFHAMFVTISDKQRARFARSAAASTSNNVMLLGDAN